MPSSLSVTLIGFGAVLTSVSGVAGAIVAGAGFGFELFLAIAVGPPEDEQR